jgi:hypothetical protein
VEGGDAPWQLTFHGAAAHIRFHRPVSLAALQNTIVLKCDAPATIPDQIGELYRSESRRVFASLVRLLNDFDLAHDAMHEAYAAAWRLSTGSSDLLICTAIRLRGVRLIRKQ